MISVVILGSGNVALQLIRAFLKIDTINLKQVYTRNQEDINTLKDSINTTNDISLLKQADVTIIAVSDDAISSISSHIKNSFVVHTSGSVDMKSLNNIGRKGVFYPLQSFSKKKKVDFKNIPICLESETNEDLLKLEKLVSLLQSKSYILSSHQRKKIHVAAVFANNFSHLVESTRSLELLELLDEVGAYKSLSSTSNVMFTNSLLLDIYSLNLLLIFSSCL